MQTIQSLASRISLGIPVGTEHLGMVPIIRSAPSQLRYDTLQAGLAAKTLRITEVGLGGSVPEVQVENHGALPVLILEGAALVGAKQNRVLNLTVLVPAKAGIRVPVSCVEQGRWLARSAEFSEGPAMHFPEGRAAKMMDVSASLLRDGSRRSNQGKIWADVARCAEDFAAHAPSGAMQDVYRAAEDEVERTIAALVPVEGQVGALFIASDGLMGLDCFDATTTFKAEFAKIARSYAVDAVRRARRAGTSAWNPARVREEADEFLALLVAGEWTAYPGVGLGTDLRLTTSRLAAGALVHEDEIAHLAAFPGKARELRLDQAHAPAMPRRRLG